ncbi:ISL3 family transposase [Fusobacterium necrophorum]|uniref:ISL3 family transposase n=2 Tax=Fusobacterium necrophorum TaxID=859 RepID=UPI00254CA90B|nr:ISL3 family transposase [Fusobacterium necrophorum]MDK4501321.1 ISL3 family transposase [Fusobacterium necrophorum]
MSHHYSINTLLKIQDPNISFSDIPKIHGYNALIFHAILTYSIEKCPFCGEKHIIRNGTKLSKIKILDVSNTPSYLYLRKQRFLCKSCSKTFSASTNFVRKYCNIADSIKLSIALESKNIISEKDIAKRFRVSSSTVKRSLLQYYDFEEKHPKTLPTHLGIDEFKSTKQALGNMSVILVDLQKREIVDILEDRRKDHLINFFQTFPMEERKKVQVITTDLYEPYLQILPKLFPNAQIILDRFHIVQLISRAFLQARIQLMKQIQDHSLARKLKKYWKLFQKSASSLSEKRYYDYSFKQYISSGEIVNFLLKKIPKLDEYYGIYQNFLYLFQHKKKENFLSLLEKYKGCDNLHLARTLKTYRKLTFQILNSIDSPFSNGVVEGFNQKIKLMKRISYGYKSFQNLRRRILICSPNSILKEGEI